MLKITLLAISLIMISSMADAGLFRSHMAYSAGFPQPEHQVNIPYGAPYAAPLPVAPVSGQQSCGHQASGYTAPTIVKFRSGNGAFGGGPFTSYSAARSHYKFAFPAPVPSLYNAPAPVSFAAPAVSYNDYEAPNTVVKFGPPITTTTTTYSTTAAAAAPAGNAVAGW